MTPPPTSRSGGEPHKGKPMRMMQVAPLQALEADVPVAYRVGAVSDAQTAVSLGVGRSITIDSEGLVRNASGTLIFRLERLP